jgi:hypothetical protein
MQNRRIPYQSRLDHEAILLGGILTTEGVRDLDASQPRNYRVRRESSATSWPRPSIARVFTLIRLSIAEARENTDFEGCFAELNALLRLPSNWDGSGAEPPNTTAHYWARKALEYFSAMNLKPHRIAASVENGIAIAFRRGAKYAYTEFHNSGAIVALVADDDTDPRIWEVDAGSQGIQDMVDQISVYLHG